MGMCSCTGGLWRQQPARLLILGCLWLLGVPGFAQSQLAVAPRPIRDDWVEALSRTTFFGDFRYRAEGDWKRPNAKDRWRSRLRLRLGANHEVRDDLLIGARLTTGAVDDSRDSNATNGDDFGKVDLTLDRLFLKWTPGGQSDFFVTLGKFAHPFRGNPVNDELLWYSDIQPEGVMFTDSARNLGPIDYVRGQAGYYIVREQAKGDIGIGVAEAALTQHFSRRTRGDFSLAWYGFSNPGNHPRATMGQYQVLNALAGIFTDILGQPWRFSGEGIHNLAATGPESLGWALGISIGGTKRKGDWRAYYQYQEVGNDALFAPVAGADFLIDHNFRGHILNLDHALSKEVTLGLRLLTAKPLDPAYSSGVVDTSYRLRFDLSVKF